MVHESIFMSQGKTIPFVRYVPPSLPPSHSRPGHTVPLPLPLSFPSVPGHDHASIGYALDAGASLIIPQVETVSQARHVISSAKFGASRRGPAGTRSAPPFRLVPGLTDSAAFTPSAMHPDVHACLNDQAAIMLQVETRAGIGQLDAVLAAVGSDVDLVWLGTLDARVSMGLPGHGGLGGAEPAWREAVDLFDATCRKYGVPRGGFAFGQGGPLRGRELVRHCEEKSLAFVVVTGDVMALAGMNGELAAAREAWAAKGQGGEGEEEDKKQVE